MNKTTLPPNIYCNGCGYIAPLYGWEPVTDPYNDIRCPNCGSTDNQHNDEYRDSLYTAVKQQTK